VAQQPFDATRWEYWSVIEVHQHDRVNAIPIDRSIYARSRRDLGDLRVTRNGQEVPYILEASRAENEVREERAAVINRGGISGAVQVTLDARGVDRHSQVRIVTDELNFRQKVKIETSPDNAFWQTVRDDGYVFDFSQGDQHISALEVSYPVSTHRYVRVSVEGWTRPNSIKDVRLVYEQSKPAEFDVIDSSTPEISADAADRATLVLMDLGQAGLPHERVRVEAGPGYFHRAVAIEGSSDRKTWLGVGRGAIYRVSGEESLQLAFPERHERYLRLRIFNADNAPIAVERVYVETVHRELKIAPYPMAGEYRLYFGNPQAKSPQYDLAVVMSKQEPVAEVSPAVREWKRNPEYQPPPGKQVPWTERYPALLYSILGAATIGMMWMTLRFFRKTQQHR
jgi:hypothetical protein